MKNYKNRKNKLVGNYCYLLNDDFSVEDNIQTILYLITKRLNDNYNINYNPFVCKFNDSFLIKNINDLQLTYDILGEVYTSIINIRNRSKEGMFFTPSKLTNNINIVFNEKDVVLDPCCGSGRLLIDAYKKGCNKIIGIELDENLYHISIINCKIEIKGDIDYQIINMDCLDYNIEDDINSIYCNPPYNSEIMDKIITKYYDSKKRMFFYLPNSILNKKHKIIFDKLKLFNYSNYGQCFDNVMSEIYLFRNDILVENEIIIKRDYWTMKNFTFFMGIVTGNNKEYLKEKEEEGYDEILTGKGIKYFKYGSHLQQAAKKELYRNKKIIYKFIGRLNTYWDEEGIFTLNSINCIIPDSTFDLNNIDILISWLNSDYVGNWLKLKYNNLKNLKEHLINIPIPYFTEDEVKKWKEENNFNFIITI